LKTRNASADELKDGTFRKEVMELTRKSCPGIAIEPGRDLMTVKFKETEIYLGNIYLAIKDLRGAERQKALLDFVLTFTQLSDDETKPGFDEAKANLRIQIAPTDFVKQIPDILHRPLSEAVVQAVVHDQGSVYRYVTLDDLKTWEISEDLVFERAIANLDAASSMTAIEVLSSASGKGRYSLFFLDDGYAAARILCPLFKQRLHKALSEKLFIVIPNRDFLVVWTKDFGERTHLVKIAMQQFDEIDHPLTKELFVSQNSQLRLADSRERAANGIE